MEYLIPIVDLEDQGLGQRLLGGPAAFQEGVKQYINFQRPSLAAPILKALQKEQCEAPSPIQEKVIPPIPLDRDVLSCMQTRTGKMAAFAVPILQTLSAQPPMPRGQKRAICSLILTPTHELTIQIGESLRAYGRYLPLHNEVIFGGVSRVPQVNSPNRGVDILVTTPGHLNDLIQQGFIDLGAVQIFVLDETDRVLDMGFVHDVKRVITRLPRQKQTLFFSATMPPEITELVDSLLVEPIKVAVAPVSSTVDAIERSVYFVDRGNRPELLIDLLKHSEVESALVFTRTKHRADRVARELARAKTQVQAIHSSKSQMARQQALSSFRARQVHILMATDIAARGINIGGLSHIINYNLPNVPETYVHRISCTGRAGLDETTISFCNVDEEPYLKDIEALIGKPIPVVEDHPYPVRVFTLTPPKQPTPRPQRAQPPQHHEKQRGEGMQRQERPRQAEKASSPDVQKQQAQPKSSAKTKQRKEYKGAAARLSQVGRAESISARPAEKKTAEPKRQAVRGPHTPKPADRRMQQEPAAVGTETRAIREQNTVKPAKTRKAAGKDATRHASRGRLERQPEPERQSTPPVERKEDYLTSLGPRRKGKSPRPLLTREHTSKKPADRFLSDKPYLRKG